VSGNAVKIVLPTVARIDLDPSREESLIGVLRAALTYHDGRVDHQLARLRHARWMDKEERAEKMEELKAQSQQCLLFRDQTRGCWWTYSGLADKVAALLGTRAENEVEYPFVAGGELDWKTPPKYDDRPYQTDSRSALLTRKHAAVELGTGLGKSFIILKIARQLALKTVIMAPSTSIAGQLYDDLAGAFGKRTVGLYGDGSKEWDKLITVAIAASLVRLDHTSAAAQNFRRSAVFISDESHLNPADTLSRVCLGLMGAAPYRFFFSATQMRTDGLDLLLEGITGPVVYRKSVREGISEGYLSALDFAMVRTHSPSSYVDRDVNAMTQCHLYYNPVVNQQAAEIANGFAERGQQVLVLVDEMEQYARLQPLLRYASKFAHGGVTRANRERLPEAFWKSDPKKFVGEFNRGEFPILVGTTCISTGTNICANEATVNLQGGKSEIAVMQGPCGRSTRLHTFADGRKKTRCAVIDFDVQNVPDMHRHAGAREAIYEQVAPVRSLEFP
jgi:superfamily II DNA or RNA helicase